MKGNDKVKSPVFTGDSLFNQLNDLNKMTTHQEYYNEVTDVEYVVEGSVLGCKYGSNLTTIHLSKDYAVFDKNGNAVLTECDSGPGENVYSFGVCSSPCIDQETTPIISIHRGVPYNTNVYVTGPKCMMMLAPKWQGQEAHTYIYNEDKDKFVKALLQTDSLVCVYGVGLITVKEVNSNGLSKEALFAILDSYLQGNVTDSIADGALKKIAGNQTLDTYKTDIPGDTNNYQRYDCYIIGWTDYYNDRFFNNGNMVINGEYIKAIMWMETRIGFYSNSSPNANPGSDVMQVLDPRNPTIYDFCTYNLDTSSNVKIYDKKNNYVLPITLDKNYSYKKTRTTYNTLVADRLFSKKGDGYYYYQYKNATPLLSIALGVKTYAIKLQSANGNDLLAVQEYNGSNHKIIYKNNVDSLVNHKGNLHAQNYHT